MYVETEHILLLYQPWNEAVEDSSKLLGHQMQTCDAEGHSSVQPGIQPQVSLDFLCHVLVHLFQIPQWFRDQVLV